jgi:GNAT superfamily N-acetyltransferase
VHFTDGATFANHDPERGRTLYGAEVMVDPDCRGRGCGKALYKARRDLVRRLKLLRIRAGARLRSYGKYAEQMSAQEYVRKVIDGEIGDPTLSFQLKQGFRVIAVVQSYIPDDPESRGYAAIIEWINHEVAARRDYRRRDPNFGRRRSQRAE